MPRRLFVSTVVTLLVLCQAYSAPAQSSFDTAPAIAPIGWMPINLVDCPTAGTLRRGRFDVVVRSYPNGGILSSINIGLSNRFMVGVSYGAEGIIAEESPNWNPRVEFNVKLSLVDEGLVFPAMTVGFCSQGTGSYYDRWERYDYKSKGFYAVASKNYPFYNWQVGLHGGVNFSMEKEDDDENISFFLGCDTRLNRDVGLVVEYDFAFNDDQDLYDVQEDTRIFGKGNGYLNMALQWLYTDNLIMEVLLKNLNNNRGNSVDIWRGLRVTYYEDF